MAELQESLEICSDTNNIMCPKYLRYFLRALNAPTTKKGQMFKGDRNANCMYLGIIQCIYVSKQTFHCTL